MTRREPVATIHGIDIQRKISELLRDYPRLAELLAEQGIECADCLAADVDTLQDVARMYHLDLATLLARLDAQRSG